MKTLKDLKPLIALQKEIQHLSSAISLLSWDQETYMPPGAAQARAEQLAALKGLVHQQQVGPEMTQTLSKWLDLESGEIKGEASTWGSRPRALLRESFRDYQRATALPTDFVQRLGYETAVAHAIWTEARAKRDFSHFAPHLKKIVALKKEEIGYLGYDQSPYDPLLDTFEPGMTVAKIAPLFAALKKELVPLLKKITQSPRQISDDFLRAEYAPEAQLAFGKKVLEAMGFDFEKGRQDLSAHPFTTSFHPSDVRITTRVDPKDILSSLFSSIHEGGHALYDQGLSVEDFATPLGEPVSLGLHESQSRLWENGVGRSKAFWRHFYPIFQASFPEQVAGIGLEAFYAAINIVRPSLIRVEADELSYNLHIMLRFEIERALFEDNLPVDALPALWKEKMQAALGIEPENDAEGVLQDIHWSGGAFGYFPTYTLGNLYAAQLLDQAQQEIPDYEDQIARGQLLPLKSWLNEKIHRHGRAFSSEDLIEQVTGKPPDARYFMQDLQKKFGAIYQLS